MVRFGPRTIDANDFASAILDADDAELRVSRLGFEFGQQALRELVVPGLFGEAIDRIDAAGETRPDQPVQCGRGPKACDVAARAAHMGLQIGGDEPRMRLDAVEDARQQRLLDAAIAQPSDRGDRDRNQQDHRDG